MLYQLSYASKVRLFCPTGENSPPDPFLMSGTIVKGTITATHVQATQPLVWNRIGRALGLL
jgi:hypothetical protein